MIHPVAADQVTPDLIRKFQQEAEAIAKAGAAGFGGNRGGAFFFRTRHSMGQILIIESIRWVNNRWVKS